MRTRIRITLEDDDGREIEYQKYKATLHASVALRSRLAPTAGSPHV
jgi:hypothetical protein